MTPDEFVAAVTGGQAAAPMYFSFAASHNRKQRPTLDEHDASTPLTMAELQGAVTSGAVIVDRRDATEYAAGHLLGAINVGASRHPDRARRRRRERARSHDSARSHRLRRRRRTPGRSDRGDGSGAGARAASSRLTAQTLGVLVADTNITLIDVRSNGEAADGTIPGAINVPLPILVDQLDALDPAATIVVYCAGGCRSSIAASTMRSCGFVDVSDLIGGIGAWTASGRPTTVPVPM